MDTTSKGFQLFFKNGKNTNLRPDAKSAYLQVMNVDLPQITDIIPSDQKFCESLYKYTDEHLIDSLGTGHVNSCIKILEDPIHKYPTDEDKLNAIANMHGVRGLLPNLSAESVGIGLDDAIVDRMIKIQLQLYKLNTQHSGLLVEALQMQPVNPKLGTQPHLDISKQEPMFQIQPVPIYQKFIVGNLQILLALKNQYDEEKKARELRERAGATV